MQATPAKPMIQVKRLTKTVPDADTELHILNEVSFSVEQGQSIAIVGASGSGKSTLLGLMAGLDVPSSGEVLIQGQSLFGMNEEGRALFRSKTVGFVFQSFQLLSHLTALENVCLPLELSGQSDIRTKAMNLLKQVGLAERLHHTPKTLSGGEQQRVALARAFVTNPAVLFADEPTGSLDSATGQRIIELMFNLQASHGTTLVLVTHDEKLALRCQRQIHIQQGVYTEGNLAGGENLRA
jgi:putative ABC transport system ATP-binding protein